MSDRLIIWVDFLKLGIVLLLEANEDKQLVFLGLEVFLEEGWMTFDNLVKYKKIVFEVLTPIFLLWIEKFGWNLIKDEGLFLDFLLFSSSGLKFNIFCLSKSNWVEESSVFLLTLELEEYVSL